MNRELIRMPEQFLKDCDEGIVWIEEQMLKEGFEQISAKDYLELNKIIHLSTGGPYRNADMYETFVTIENAEETCRVYKSPILKGCLFTTTRIMVFPKEYLIVIAGVAEQGSGEDITYFVENLGKLNMIDIIKVNNNLKKYSTSFVNYLEYHCFHTILKYLGRINMGDHTLSTLKENRRYLTNQN
jgi:hypothetical protein